MYFEDLNLSMTMRMGKITISGRALGSVNAPASVFMDLYIEKKVDDI